MEQILPWLQNCNHLKNVINIIFRQNRLINLFIGVVHAFLQPQDTTTGTDLEISLPLVSNSF